MPKELVHFFLFLFAFGAVFAAYAVVIFRRAGCSRRDQLFLAMFGVTLPIWCLPFAFFSYIALIPASGPFMAVLFIMTRHSRVATYSPLLGTLLAAALYLNLRSGAVAIADGIAIAAGSVLWHCIVLASLLFWLRTFVATGVPARWACPNCGYDLRSLPRAIFVCPECGQPFRRRKKPAPPNTNPPAAP